MKIGIALSGGGVRGAAHIGVIKALEENNINIDIVGGTSAGSIVSVLYACGYNTEEILKLFNFFSRHILKNTPITGKRESIISKYGFVSGQNIELDIKEAAEYKGMKTIKDLPKTIVIPTVDILTSKKYVFTNNKNTQGDTYIKNIEIGKAVRASSSYPGVYAPFKYENYMFVDGGLLDNIPSEEVKKAGADKVITVKFRFEPNGNPQSTYGIVTKSIDLVFERLSEIETKHSDYVLNIDLKDISIFNMRKITECYKLGYTQTNEQIEKIKEILNN